jgi:hypothetical protein
MNATGASSAASDRTRTSKAIRELNDKFRTSSVGGRIVVTAGVAALSEHKLLALLQLVRSFDVFSADNDPYEEHDFGAIDFGDERYFWKIDYYDRSMEAGSENPADPASTTRVLTLMRADEY